MLRFCNVSVTLPLTSVWKLNTFSFCWWYILYLCLVSMPLYASPFTMMGSILEILKEWRAGSVSIKQTFLA